MSAPGYVILNASAGGVRFQSYARRTGATAIGLSRLLTAGVVVTIAAVIGDHSWQVTLPAQHPFGTGQQWVGAFWAGGKNWSLSLMWDVVYSRWMLSGGIGDSIPSVGNTVWLVPALPITPLKIDRDKLSLFFLYSDARCCVDFQDQYGEHVACVENLFGGNLCNWSDADPDNSPLIGDGIFFDQPIAKAVAYGASIDAPVTMELGAIFKA